MKMNNKLIEFDDLDREVFEELRIFSDVESSVIETIFERLLFYVASKYLSNETIRIPYITDISVDEKNLDLTFKVNNNIVKLLQQLKKAKVSGRLIEETDIGKLIMKRIGCNLKERMDS
jgi:hypothetical protein